MLINNECELRNIILANALKILRSEARSYIYDKSKILPRNCFCINTDRGYSLFKGLYSIYWYCFPSVTFKAL